MMRDRLESVSIMAIVVHGMIGIRLLTLPRDVVQHAGTDAWISMLLASVITFITGYAFYWIGLKYPGLNFSQINEKVLGKFLGKFCLVVIGVYTLSSTAMLTRDFADTMDIFLLDFTPDWVIIIIIISACTYCVSAGVKTLSTVFDITFPLILITVIALLGLSTSAADPKNLLPVFQKGAVPVLKGTLEIIDPVLTTGVVGYLLPYFIKPESIKKWMFIGITIGSLIYLIIITLCIMVFGSNEVKYLVFPTLTLTKSIQLTVQIFERAESMLMVAWIPITFTTLVEFYFVSVLNFKALFNIKKDRAIIYALAPISVILALLPGPITSVFRYLSYNAALAQVLNLIYIPLFTLVVFIKTRRKSQ